MNLILGGITMHVRKLMLPTLLLAVIAPLPVLGLQADAAPAKCRKACDTTAPVVSISAPGDGAKLRRENGLDA